MLVKQINTGKKENLNWDICWNEDEIAGKEIERIVYNEEYLELHRKRYLKILRKDIKNIREKFSIMKRKYTKKMKKKMKKELSVRGYKLYEAYQLKETTKYRSEMVEKLKEKDKIFTKTLVEYYDSLNYEFKMKLINEKKSQWFSHLPTEKETNANESDEEINENEESDEESDEDQENGGDIEEKIKRDIDREEFDDELDEGVIENIKKEFK
jgi:hypothetical protein